MTLASTLAFLMLLNRCTASCQSLAFAAALIAVLNSLGPILVPPTLRLSENTIPTRSNRFCSLSACIVKRSVLSSSRCRVRTWCTSSGAARGFSFSSCSMMSLGGVIRARFARTDVENDRMHMLDALSLEALFATAVGPPYTPSYSYV